MDEEERFNVNEEICGKMCWQGYHKCFDKEHENELLGVDVERIKDDFRNCVEEKIYYCESCEFEDNNMQIVQDHFLLNHEKEPKFSCWKCDQEFKAIYEFRRHVGSYHYTTLEN